MTGAHREAAAQYARVLRHASGIAPAERADLLSAHALEAQASGGYEEAITALNDAVELRRTLGERLRAGDHLARLTMPYHVSAILRKLSAKTRAEAAAAAAKLGLLQDRQRRCRRSAISPFPRRTAPRTANPESSTSREQPPPPPPGPGPR